MNTEQELMLSQFESEGEPWSAANAFIDSGDGVSLTEAAQKINVKPTRFFTFLINNNYCHDVKNWKYKPYQKHIDAGYFKPRTNYSGVTQTLVLPKGINYFSKKSVKEKIEKESKERRYSQPHRVTVRDIIESVAQEILNSLPIAT